MRKFFLIIAVSFSVLIVTGCDALKSMHSTYADYRGDVNANYMVQDARNRILSYDWFYDQYGQIQAQVANVEGLVAGDENRASMVRVVNSMIAEYNSRSMQYNHNMWKATDLPFEIELYKGVSK